MVLFLLVCEMNQHIQNKVFIYYNQRLTRFL
ncbi:hypothetical protein VCB_003238 [Vibrio cholerae TMA 21]|nr:hypothetical protein VCB_003238 [Vibrio cholerae TMA 21]